MDLLPWHDDQLLSLLAKACEDIEGSLIEPVIDYCVEHRYRVGHLAGPAMHSAIVSRLSTSAMQHSKFRLSEITKRMATRFIGIDRKDLAD
jgi:hypothetical protein